MSNCLSIYYYGNDQILISADKLSLLILELNT